ncbi:MAG TPA: hypothetical protein VG992_03335 [Candidatus Saccharimonadales bacterium]|nr:hypothetical protein [Candidatus Saccharimonadales bacterium]
MSKMPTKLSSQALLERSKELIASLGRYRLVLFVVLVAALYGLVLTRLNSLINTEPSDDAVTSQVQAARIPHIEPSVINQLQSLKNNSVSVQALFNQQRNNPF